MATQTLPTVPVVPRASTESRVLPRLRRGPLPPAIDAERRTYRSHVAGDVATYVSEARPGVPVVLLHGIHAAASSFEMKPLFQALREDHQVIAVDLPGFGASDRSDRAYTRELYATFLEEYLSSIATTMGPPHVVALSLTSELVARVAAKVPGIFSSLTLLSPTGLGLRAHRPSVQKRENRIAAVAQRVLDFPVVGVPLFSALRSRTSLRYFLSKSFAGPIDHDLLEYSYATSHQPGARHAPLAFLSGRLFDSQIHDTYARLTVPTAVLFDEDANTTFERLPDLTTLSTYVTATRIPGTRGLPHYDRPDKTLEALRAHFAAASLVPADSETLPAGSMSNVAGA